MPLSLPSEVPSTGDISAAVWAYVTRRLTNLSDVRAARIDNLDVLLSSRLSKADFDTKLPDVRVARIDEITAARIAELDAANMPADLDTLLSRIGDPSPLTIADLLATIIAAGVATGAPLMDGNVQTIFEATEATIGDLSPGHIEGYIDLSNMQAGDTIVLTESASLVTPATYRVYATHTYSDVQTEPLVHFTLKYEGLAWKLTAQQTVGGFRTLRYFFWYKQLV